MESKSIFLDLEIDTKLIMENPDEFAKQCYQAADRLSTVLESKNSINGAKSEAENEALKNKGAKKAAQDFFRDIRTMIYEAAESMDMDTLYYLQNEVRELARDLDITFHSRARNSMILNSPNATDKKMAHDQYMRLRTNFESFRQVGKLIHEKNYAPIAPRSGNYGSDSKVSYPAYKVDGQVYHNYRAVARLLGWNPDDFKSHQDLRERIEAEELNTVEIVEVTL